jgi:hypothetical protein
MPLISNSPAALMKRELEVALRGLSHALDTLDATLERDFELLALEGTKLYPLHLFIDPPTTGTALTYARHVIRTIDRPTGSVDSRTTAICPGLMAARAATIQAAHEVNIAKDRFRAAYDSMRGKYLEIEDKERCTNRREPLLKASLNALGRPHLHYWAAIRRLVVLDSLPASVSFHWAASERITRISLSEARARLERMRRSPTPSPHLERQFETLTKLERAGDQVLAVRRSPHVHPKATVVSVDEAGVFSTTFVRAVLPILYPGPARPGRPRFRALPRGQDRPQRLRRSDRLIESQPALPSIHAYRYREGYRQHGKRRPK